MKWFLNQHYDTLVSETGSIIEKDDENITFLGHPDSTLITLYSNKDQLYIDRMFEKLVNHLNPLALF